MDIEYDVNKSKIKKQKHGISFEEAKKLFEDDALVVIPAKTVDNEQRFALISKFLGKCFVAIFTFRGGNIRIISVRRCRKNEEAGYENHS